MTPSYTTAQAVKDYAPDLTFDDATLDATISLAEEDIDQLVLPPTERLDNGRKLDPAALSTGAALALNRATCAQTVYRVEMGPRFFRRAQYDKVSGPDFTTEGKLPLLSPQTVREARQDPSGTLLVGSTTARSTRRPLGSGPASTSSGFPTPTYPWDYPRT